MTLNPILILISIVDFIAAFFLVWSFPGDFMLAISVILMLKGIYSIVSALHASFYFDFMGAIDFFAGILLLIVNFGTMVEFAWIVGIILALKASYTSVSSL